MPRVAAKRIDQAGWTLEPERYEKELRKAINEIVKPEVISLFEEVVEGKRYSTDGDAWEHEVSFRARFQMRGKDAVLYIFPTGPNKQIWRWVSKGTRPHEIVAKNAPALSFMWGGPGSPPPKTTTPPGSGGAVGGGFGAVALVHFVKVDHPGSKPRKFEERIAKDYKKRFSRVINDTIRRLVQEKNRPYIGRFGI